MTGTATFAEPKPVTIYDDIQDKSVAVQLDPAKVPAVVVFCDSDAAIEMDWGQPLQPFKGENIIMAVSYIYRGGDPLIMRQQGMFVLRAIRRSLRRFNSDRYSENKRRLNGIQIVQVMNIREQRVTGAVGKSTLAGFVLANLDVTDHEP